MRSELEEQIFAGYRNMQLGTNAHCVECRATSGNSAKDDFCGPVSLWQAGRHFGEDPYRLLFVGKTACNDPGTDDGDIVDATAWADDAIMGRFPRTARSAYWTYTREIIEQVFAESASSAWERIAFTNLLKCNTSADLDTASGVMKTNCLNNVGVFKAELKVLCPKTIVIYSGLHYDAYLGPALFGDNWRDDESCGRSHRVACGNKSLLWWSGSVVGGESPCRVLRVGHPSRMDRADFVNYISQWITAGSQSFEPPLYRRIQ